MYNTVTLFAYEFLVQDIKPAWYAIVGKRGSLAIPYLAM